MVSLALGLDILSGAAIPAQPHRRSQNQKIFAVLAKSFHYYPFQRSAVSPRCCRGKRRVEDRGRRNPPIQQEEFYVQ